MIFGSRYFYAFNVSFRSNSFTQMCSSITLWSNDVYHRLSKNCFLALQSFLLASLAHVKPLPFRLLRLRRYGSINVRFHICRQGAPKARELNLVRDSYFQVTLLASGRERSRYVHIIWTIDRQFVVVGGAHHKHIIGLSLGLISNVFCYQLALP